MLIEDLLYRKLNRKKTLTNRAAKQENRKDEQLHFDLHSDSTKTKVRVSSRVNHFELTNPKTVHAHVFCFLFSQS